LQGTGAVFLKKKEKKRRKGRLSTGGLEHGGIERGIEREKRGRRGKIQISRS